MQKDTGGKKFFPTSAAWQERKIKAKYNSPFAQSISNTLHFKLARERSPQPQTVQDGLLHP